MKVRKSGTPWPDKDEANRFLGCLLGLAVGDAVGASVEFKKRGSFSPNDVELHSPKRQHVGLGRRGPPRTHDHVLSGNLARA